MESLHADDEPADFPSLEDLESLKKNVVYLHLLFCKEKLLLKRLSKSSRLGKSDKTPMFKNKLNLRNVVVIAICLTATAFFSACSAEKTTERQVRLSLEGKRYDNLSLLVRTQIATKTLRVDGTSTDGYNWIFVIPDSISEVALSYEIRPQNDNLSALGEHYFPNVHGIAFQTIVNGDTLTGREFNFDKNENIIELKAKFGNTLIQKNTHHIAELDTTIVLQVIKTDVFTIPLPENTFLRENMQTPAFSFFWDANNPDKTYEEFLIKYAELIKGNPNSLYFISNLAVTPHFYKSRQDIEKLFNLFSPEMQNSMWGEIVRRNFAPIRLELADVFLPNSFTREYERIILEPEKHTLLCFSASWCGPCVRAIPRLKAIHERTKGKLNLVYISIDENIADWNALMERENIAWRSLWLTDGDLKSQWNISAIPDYILVYPNGYARKIFLSTEEDIQELYAVLGIE